MSGSGEYTPEKINQLKSNAIHLRNTGTSTKVRVTPSLKKSKNLQQYDTEIVEPLSPPSPPIHMSDMATTTSKQLDPEELKAQVAKVYETINPKIKADEEDDDDRDSAAKLLTSHSSSITKTEKTTTTTTEKNNKKTTTTTTTIKKGETKKDCYKGR